MKTLVIDKNCWCEEPILSFDEKSTHEVIIRRYIGQHGYLVDVYYHPKCYKAWSDLDWALDEIFKTDKTEDSK